MKQAPIDGPFFFLATCADVCASTVFWALNDFTVFMRLIVLNPLEMRNTEFRWKLLYEFDQCHFNGTSLIAGLFSPIY